MVAKFTCCTTSKRCRYMNIFVVLLFLMICMLLIQTPEKPPQASLKRLEYVTKYNLKFLMANASIQALHPKNSSLRYLVNTTKCKVPNLDPYNFDVIPFYELHSYRNCEQKPLLTFVTKENNVATLHVNYRHAFYYGDSVTCCYANITRQSTLDEPDSDFLMTGCKPFISSIILKEEVVYVSCIDQNQQIVYKNIHAVVTVNDNVQKKRLKQNYYDKVKAFSILLIGIDSVSRLNFIRTLPKTHEFVQKNGWVEFKAYNKVGDNTFPNVMAFLTGRNEASAFSDCKPRTIGGLNNCNLIWYDFRNFNYITAYAEDQADINTFNYLKKGFVAQPADYYFRHYFMSTESYLDPFHIDGLSYCTGPVATGERVLNIAKEFTTTFMNNSYFGFFWMNSYSHNTFNGCSRMDRKLMDFFNEMNRTNALDNTIIIFLSDHGFRFGQYIYTHSGWLEERLPFFYMHMPHRFKQLFPIQYNYLLQNANKLTSPYNLYMTLQEILVLSGKKYTVKASSGCPLCKSLFQEIPQDRTCADSGINSQWCSCNTYFTISPKNLLVNEAVKFLLNDIHKIIVREGSDFEQCSHFSFSKVFSARVSEGYKEEDTDLNYLIVTFEVEPKAVFQGAVSINMSTEWPNFKLEGNIRRVDYYGHHSWCTNNSVLKQYCYCQDKVTLFLRLVNVVGRQVGKLFTSP